jgi:hypothetical protein
MEVTEIKDVKFGENKEGEFVVTGRATQIKLHSNT